MPEPRCLEVLHGRQLPRREGDVLLARPRVLEAVAGFARVEVDPRGFRSGSMNELLPDPVRYR